MRANSPTDSNARPPADSRKTKLWHLLLRGVDHLFGPSLRAITPAPPGRVAILTISLPHSPRRENASYALILLSRGQSGRLRNPDEYALPQYCADINALIARLGAEEVDWVGTSLGGLTGIVLAALPGSSIRRMVINDIGPFPGKASRELERI